MVEKVSTGCYRIWEVYMNMTDYKKYVELNHLVYDGDVVGYRVSFYVITPSATASRVLYKKCDTFEKSIAGVVKISRIGRNINMKLYGDVLISEDEENAVEVDTSKEMRMYKKKFDEFFKKRVNFGERSKEIGESFLNMLYNSIGYESGRVECEEVSARYLGGYSAWVHKDYDDDFPEMKKSLDVKLDYLIKEFNRKLEGFKVVNGVVSEKAWVYFGIVER